MKLSSCCFKLSRKLPYLSRLSIFGALHRYITAYVGPSNAPCPDDLAFSSTGDDISAGYEIVLYRKTESSLETVKIFLSTGSSSFQIQQLETGYYRLINNLFKSYFPLSLSLLFFPLDSDLLEWKIECASIYAIDNKSRDRFKHSSISFDGRFALNIQKRLFISAFVHSIHNCFYVFSFRVLQNVEQKRLG